MKNVIVIIGAALMILAFHCCTKADFEGADKMPAAQKDEVIFSATFEQAQAQESKTHLGGEGNHQILWNKADAIRIWDISGKSGRYTAVSDGLRSDFVKSSADEGFSPETSVFAFYPESAVSGFDGRYVKFIIPATQTYAQNSFGPESNFAVSKIVDAEEGDLFQKVLSFSNVAGVLRIQLSCSETSQKIYVSRIVLKDRSQNICGTFKVDVTEDKPSASFVENGGQSITLNCGVNGVPLSTDATNPTSFYFTLPVNAIAQNSGFVAEVYNNYDHLVTVLKTSNKDGKATITRSNITKMNNKICSWLPAGTVEGYYLKSKTADGNRSTFINTRVSPSNGIRIQMRGTMDQASTVEGYGNPAFCGLIDPTNETTWSPWVTIDYHKGIGGVRANSNGNSQFSNPVAGLGQMVDLDVSFFTGTNKFTGNINGTTFTSTIGNGALPTGSNFFLFAQGKYNTSSTTGVENRAICSIYSFVMYDKDDKMVRNFIPVCYNGTNGMWDVVNGVFYGPYTSNSLCGGSFILGTSSSHHVEQVDPTLVFSDFSIEGGKLLSIQDKKVSIEMPFGTDLTQLTASYSTNALQVLVGSKEQSSGVTINDFSQPVTYRLKSSFGYNDWTVTVTLGPEPGKDPSLKFTSFTVQGGGMVSSDGNTIMVAVKSGTNLTSLVPTFTTNADKVYVKTKEQVSGVTANDFSGNVVYKLESEAGINEITVRTIQLGLPALFIKTSAPASTITKDDWMGGTSAVLFDSGTGTVDILGAADDAESIAVNEIKGRGNTTWNYPKKPYTIKLAKKESILGMPKDKRWNLLANWMDRTNMRNDIAFQLARVSPGLDWTPNGRYVELFMNGEHKGNYYLCEHIKISKDRVNITGYDEEAPAPANEIGYLFELDTYFDEANRFRSSLNLPVNVKDPDAEGFDLTYISGWFNALESKLKSANMASTDYKDYLDIDSFVDWFLVHEMTSIWEPNHPKSSYMYKNSELAADNKIHAGPCWDFDYDTFTPGKTNAWIIKDAIWYKYLFKDPAFVSRLKQKWAAQKSAYSNVAANYIDSVASMIRASVSVDKKMWPCTSTVNGDEQLGFSDAVARVKQSLQAKITFMDNAIKSL